MQSEKDIDDDNRLNLEFEQIKDNQNQLNNKCPNISFQNNIFSLNQYIVGNQKLNI
jgi:hypothetical protein